MTTRVAVARLVAATLATGVAAGLLGVGLTLLLHAVQHLLYGYTEGHFLAGVEHASARRRVLALAGTGAVAGLAWWLARRAFAATPVSVSGALRRPRPDLPAAATLVDAVIQIVAVGGGASLGREGAPRQVGALAGAQLARRLRLDVPDRRVLLACGAGAGLAAVYDVPLGGAAFTLEVLLATPARAALRRRAAVPALVTAAIAAQLGRRLLHDSPTYPLPRDHASLAALGWAPLLGVLAGLGGLAFTRLMSAARRNARHGAPLLVSVPVAFTALGALAVAYPQLPGNGKGPTSLAVDGALGLGLAATLLVLKPLVTALCLGAGAIGGLLTPALATGALLGAVVAGLAGDRGSAAIALGVSGAGALLAVTQRAPVTAVLLTVEFVGVEDQPHRVLPLLAPLLVAVAAAVVTARLVRRLRRG